ncbi:MAG: long-chain fatty acid--CoA ligase [Pseudomonadota bacterium]
MAETNPVTGDDAAPWLKSYPADIKWEFEAQHRPVFDLLDDAVARFADRPCTDFMDRKTTYGEMGAMTQRLAAGLQSIGIGPGTKVGLFFPNCPYYIAAYHAVLKCGAVVVNYNPLYAERELAHQIDDSETEVMITLDLKVLHDKLVPLVGKTKLKTIIVASMAKALPFPKSWLFPIVKRADVAKIPSDAVHKRLDDLLLDEGAFKPVDIDPHQTAVLQYTGGTTGVPKGAMLSHSNLYNNAVQSALWFNKCKPGQERGLVVLPFFHVFAMTAIMNFCLYYGAEMILVPRFELEPVLKIIDKKKPTIFPAVPTIYMAVANFKDLSRYSIDSINYCISGGAPLPLEVRNAFIKVTGCQLVEGYGLTEAAPVTACNPIGGVNKEGSIGLPIPGTSVEVVSLNDPSQPVPQGEKGELCFRGPQIMQGYHNKPEATADVLTDGRLRTADVGYLDEDGYIFIVDRIKDIIIAGGYNIYPRMVEEGIYLHPAIAECIVAGIPDEYRGETVKAFIKLAEGQSLTAEELTDFLKDKLAPMEMPKEIEFRDELPKTMIGKLDRKAVREEELAKRTSNAA